MPIPLPQACNIVNQINQQDTTSKYYPKELNRDDKMTQISAESEQDIIIQPCAVGYIKVYFDISPLK